MQQFKIKRKQFNKMSEKLHIRQRFPLPGFNLFIDYIGEEYVLIFVKNDTHCGHQTGYYCLSNVEFKQNFQDIMNNMPCNLQLYDVLNTIKAEDVNNGTD